MERVGYMYVWSVWGICVYVVHATMFLVMLEEGAALVNHSLRRPLFSMCST